MTKEEAQRESVRRMADEPGALWVPKESAPGEWEPTRARVAGLGSRGPLKPAVQPPPPAPHPETDPQPRQLPYWPG